jgi:uncharacterized protein YndB with AHSA1/START domain
MGPISLTIAIDAPRERVFDFVADLGRRPAWTDHFIRDYRLERLEPSGKGAAARFALRAPGGIRHMETVISEADRPRRIVEDGRGGRWNRIPIHTIWEMTEGPGSLTTVTLTFWTEPDAFARLREAGRGGWWKRRWGRALRRLREAIESGAEEVAPVRVAGGAHLPV